MKFNWLFLIFTICATTQMQAQFSLGATGGLNFSNVHIKDVPDNFDINNDQIVYQYFGIIPKYQITEKLSISCNVEYSSKGYQFPIIGTNMSESNVKVRLDYIDFIPKIEYSPIRAISFGAGMYIGAKLDENFKLAGSDWENPSMEVFEDSDIGLVGSIRGNFKNFFVMVGYNYGLKNIGGVTYTNSNGEPFAESKEVNRNLQVGVGYFFDFKKGEG